MASRTVLISLLGIALLLSGCGLLKSTQQREAEKQEKSIWRPVGETTAYMLEISKEVQPDRWRRTAMIHMSFNETQPTPKLRKPAKSYVFQVTVDCDKQSLQITNNVAAYREDGGPIFEAIPADSVFILLEDYGMIGNTISAACTVPLN